MTERSLVCIVCPVGCRLKVRDGGGPGRFTVEGHGCARGEEYALAEVISPTRTVTSTVKIKNAPLPRLPVKTARPIPKALVSDCMRELERVEVSGPVRAGQVIIADLLGTGVDVVATRSL